MTDDNDDLGGIDETVLETWFQKRKAQDEREAARKKPPKDFNDAADRIIDRLFERIEERATEREAAADAADQEPTRGAKSGGGFLGLLGGGE